MISGSPIGIQVLAVGIALGTRRAAGSTGCCDICSSTCAVHPAMRLTAKNPAYTDQSECPANNMWKPNKNPRSGRAPSPLFTSVPSPRKTIQPVLARALSQFFRKARAVCGPRIFRAYTRWPNPGIFDLPRQRVFHLITAASSSPSPIRPLDYVLVRSPCSGPLMPRYPK